MQTVACLLEDATDPAAWTATIPEPEAVDAALAGRVLVSVQGWRRIDAAVKRDILDELIHHLEADFLVSLLPPPEAHLDPDLHVIAEKLDGVVALGGEVVLVDHL